MNKTLITYFSASGVTKRVSEHIAPMIKADLFEIEPLQKYTNEDLDWTNKTSRSTLEMQDKNCRPEIKEKINDLNNYDTIVLGFPVWWYTAPRIINTFLEENDLIGKKIYVYVTSGGSSFAGSLQDLKETYPNLNFISGKRLNGNETEEEISDWIN